MENSYLKRIKPFGSEISPADATEALPPVLVFVGDSVVFSSRLLERVGADFPGTDVIHITDMAGVQRLDPLIRSAVSIVVIDETAAGDLAEVNSRLSLFGPDVGIVFAYRTSADARRLLIQSRQDSQCRPLRFLPMNVEIDAWLASLKLIILGEDFVPSEILGGQAKTAEPEPCRRDPDGAEQQPARVQRPGSREMENLTSREKQVIALIAKGHRNSTIADELGLSVHTVKLHVHNIFGKLGVDNRTSASHKFFTHNASS